jgi:lipid A 3-O-deacylase
MCFRLTTNLQCLAMVIVLFLLVSTTVQAQDKVPEFFTLTIENDLFVGEDDGYTNGIGLTFGKGPFNEFNDEILPGWLHRLTSDLYISTLENKRRGVAHMFFQRMQTPADISTSELIVDDLPYVGLFAWQGTLYAWDDRVTDQLSLYLGVVGPIALAEQTQSFVHGITGGNDPNGCDNQI